MSLTDRELTARDLGAHPCRFATDAENPYIERDTDPALAQAIADPGQQLIIVSGPRLSGATRTLARAAQQRLANHVVIGFHDDPSITVQEMVATAAGYLTPDQPAVLWLDGLSPTRYTELATLDPAALPTGLRILATLDSADLDGYRISQSVRDHIDSYATTVELPTLSSTERDHLHSEPAYKALASVLDEGDDLLLGHLMVSWDRMRAGLTPATGEEATDRIALLRAVTDWARISPPRRLNGDILPHLYRAYRNELTGQTSVPDRSQTRYKRALAWATTPHNERPLLIDERTDGSGTYFTAHPLLTVIANEQEEPVSWPVSDQMWTYANLFFEGAQRRDLGYTALRLEAHLAADRLLDHETVDVDPYAMQGLANWFRTNDQPENAIKWYLRVVETEHPDVAPKAMVNIGGVEQARGRANAAHTWYTRAVETQHADAAPSALVNLGVLERARGRIKEARSWLAQAANTQHPDAAPKAMLSIGNLEHGCGRVEKAHTWLTQAANTQHPDIAPKAMYSLGTWKYDLGQVEKARSWFTRAADSKHASVTPRAMLTLGRLELAQGRTKEGRTWLLHAVDTRHSETAPQAMRSLGFLEYELGRVEESLIWFTRAIDTGHPEVAAATMFDLGCLKNEQGELEESYALFSRAANTNHPDAAPKAMQNLGLLERILGRVEEARICLTRAVGTGHPDAAPKGMDNLGRLERDLGRTQEARAWLTQAVNTGHPEVTASAALALRKIDELEQEHQRADQFSQYGWQAYADLRLMHRPAEHTNDEDSGPPP